MMMQRMRMRMNDECRTPRAENPAYRRPSDRLPASYRRSRSRRFFGSASLPAFPLHHIILNPLSVYYLLPVSLGLGSSSRLPPCFPRYLFVPLTFLLSTPLSLDCTARALLSPLSSSHTSLSSPPTFCPSYSTHLLHHPSILLSYTIPVPASPLLIYLAG